MFKELTFYSLLVITCCVANAQSYDRKSLIYEDTLGLDLFVPTSSSDKKPLLIYVHGGGFSGGRRDHPDHIAFCERYAEKGWVTATISYHLTMKGKSFSCDQAVQNKINTMFTAAQNIHQAVDFIIENETSVNPAQVVLAGSSAGAEAVIHAVYWDNTKNNILDSDFKYAGMISMAGALLDQRWVTNESAVPSAFFHGTCDELVPYGNAPHHYCDANETGFMMLYGSHSLAMRLGDLNQQYFLVTDCGGGHEWASKPIGDDHIYLIDDFLKNDVLQGKKRQTHLVLGEGSKQCDRMGFCE